MNTGLGLHQRLSQQLSITPQMIQSLKIMQLSIPELLDHIQHEVSENPFLVETRKNDLNINESVSNQRDERLHNEEYQDYYNENRSKKSNLVSGADKTSIIEKTASRQQNLSELLNEQLSFVFDTDSIEYKIGIYIIGSVDADGFLKNDAVLAIAEEFKCDPAIILEIKQIIQRFEPVGIASENMLESLLVQLELFDDNIHLLAREILNNHFELLIKKKTDEIVKHTGASLNEVEDALHAITLLEPTPGKKYQEDGVNFVIPDVVVKKIGGEFQISVNEEVLPELTFYNEYEQILKDIPNDESKLYLKQKEEDAKNLINSIKYRYSNLQKVVSKLVVIQKEFFLNGPSFLAPYTLVKLSEEIGINQGTLSRIINSKFIDTEWGIFSLKIFFSSSFESKQGSVSSNAIKEHLKELLESHKGDKKLSDQMLVEMLKKKGIDIARRTVAKYRKELKILSSFHR